MRRALVALSNRCHAAADAEARAWGLDVVRVGWWRHEYTDRRVYKSLTHYGAKSRRGRPA